MEFHSSKANLVLFFLLALSHLLLLPGQAQISTAASPATPASGTIERITKQQILATIPPNPDHASVSEPFLTSPSGKYTAYLLRHSTGPGAGGSFGNDFCYVQVRDTETGQSVWESVCAPVSSANACTLVFDDEGLEVFDGSRSAWDSGADATDYMQTLELVDHGDMRIRDKNGELGWKASEEPRANQACGAGFAEPPFAGPIGGDRQPFGQEQQQQQQQPQGYQQQQQPQGYQQQPLGDHYQQQPLENGNGNGDANANGYGQLPLTDNTPYDSGSTFMGFGCWFHLSLALIVSVGANVFLF